MLSPGEVNEKTSEAVKDNLTQGLCSGLMVSGEGGVWCMI